METCEHCLKRLPRVCKGVKQAADCPYTPASFEAYVHVKPPLGPRPDEKLTVRKDHPICRGVLDYFPRALAYIAWVSKVGNDQHNAGEPMHWAKEKSTDHADCVLRHLSQRGTMDLGKDGAPNVRHTGKLAWRGLALLETELEEAGWSLPNE